MIRTVDVNCDMGEISIRTGRNIDVQFMPFISSCNIATGAHAGDRETIAAVMLTAAKHNLAIGAHPAYEDREYFGRRALPLSPEMLYKSVVDQLSAFLNIANELDLSVHHCKPHGALYHDLSSNTALAGSFIEAVKKVDASWIIYGFSASPFADEVKKSGMRFRHEVFADRRYKNAKKLTSRHHPNALLSKKADVQRQLDFFIHNRVTPVSEGQKVQLPVESICVHSDHDASLKTVRWVHEYLSEQDVRITHYL